MKKFLSLLFLASVFTYESKAQFTRYVIKLKNKGGTPFTFSNPQAYLSQRAIDRRTRYGIAIDSTDLPVTPSYITQIKNVPNVAVLNVSKWLNSISIQTSDPGAITTINSFPFVQSVSGIAAKINPGEQTPARNKFESEEIIGPLPYSERTEGINADFFNYGTGSFNEIHLHNGEFLHNIGLRGQGMQLTVLDGGFQNYTGLKAFDSVNINGQILSTWDFVSRNATVSDDHPHGMQCLSTIAANIPGQFIGKAPKASFHLFRTEDVATEYPIEEHNWVCGAERADSIGSDIISSSLGYFDFDNATLNHTYGDMNGNTTMAAIGADLAAKKGLILFNSIGNEGGTAWHFLATPSDGDSVVAVGAVTTTGVVGGFSSYGPSSDGQIKPDMASVGVAAMVQTTSNTVGTANGTSFACPNMAGLGTCLWQGFPEFSNIKIIRALQQAGNKFTTPDARVGYGIPNMKTAFANLLVEFATSAAIINSSTVTVSWTSKDVSAMKYEIERMAPGESAYTKIGDMNPQAGDILANHNYLFNNPLSGITSGVISYRIRQIIDTAAASFTAVYIDTTEVSLASKPVTVRPNPASGTVVTVVIETDYAVTNMPIAVYDGKGALLMQLKESKNTGRKIVPITIERFPKGKYYIKVMNGSKTIGTAELIRL